MDKAKNPQARYFRRMDVRQWDQWGNLFVPDVVTDFSDDAKGMTPFRRRDELVKGMVALTWARPDNLEAYLDAYIKAAGIADLKRYLFRATRGKTKVLTGNRLAQSNVYRMI
jgi:hypothetical protein